MTANTNIPHSKSFNWDTSRGHRCLPSLKTCTYNVWCRMAYMLISLSSPRPLDMQPVEN